MGLDIERNEIIRGKKIITGSEASQIGGFMLIQFFFF